MHTSVQRGTESRIYEDEAVLNISVREALRTRGEEAELVIMKGLTQMVTKRVWTPIVIR